MKKTDAAAAKRENVHYFRTVNGEIDNHLATEAKVIAQVERARIVARDVPDYERVPRYFFHCGYCTAAGE